MAVAGGKEGLRVLLAPLHVVGPEAPPRKLILQNLTNIIIIIIDIIIVTTIPPAITRE
jgi:hypothetical protein